MKYLLNMNLKTSEEVNHLLADNKALSIHYKVNINEFTCRYTWMDAMHGGNVTTLIDCKFVNKGIDITFAEEGSALMLKQRVPSFNMIVSLDKGNPRIIKQPSNAEARVWLNTSVGTRTVLSELVHLVIHASVALNHFEPLLQKRVYNDTIEYRFPNDFYTVASQYILSRKTEERRKNLLNGWDVVALTENQYYKVIETNTNLHTEYDMDNIPLPRFCLSIFDGQRTDYYFYDKKGKTIRCGVCDPDNYVTKFFDINMLEKTADGIKTTMHVDDNEKGLWEWLNQPVANKDTDLNWEWMADAFFIINTFMLHFGEATMDVETKETIAPSEHHNKKKSSRNTVRLFKTYKLIKNWKSKARKQAEITCPAWGVRGHFRHYRNGKVVFVEPYVKGREKDAYKGKEYVLLPYKEA